MWRNTGFSSQTVALIQPSRASSLNKGQSHTAIVIFYLPRILILFQCSRRRKNMVWHGIWNFIVSKYREILGLRGVLRVSTMQSRGSHTHQSEDPWATSYVYSMTNDRDVNLFHFFNKRKASFLTSWVLIVSFDLFFLCCTFSLFFFLVACLYLPGLNILLSLPLFIANSHEANVVSHSLDPLSTVHIAGTLFSWFPHCSRTSRGWWKLSMI